MCVRAYAYLCVCTRTRVYVCAHSCFPRFHQCEIIDVFGGATLTELALVRAMTPCVKIYKKPGGIFGYKGHGIVLASDAVVSFSKQIPRKVADCGIRVIKPADQGKKGMGLFRVRHPQVRTETNVKK